MSRRGIRIIPKTKDPVSPLVAHSMSRRWHLKGAVGRDRAKGESGEYTYLIPDTGTHVILREDALTGVHYFTIWGPGERDVAKEIRALVESYTEQELFAWWDRATKQDDVDDKVDAILFLGAGAPSSPNNEYVQRIRDALRDSDLDVRNAAIVAAGYADWPTELQPELERVAKQDPDDTAQRRAQVVIDRWASEPDEASRGG